MTTPPAASVRIPARSAELGGGLPVKRVLPNRLQRTVGAWCLLDHIGPTPENTANVGPHPHIGLQTFSWMIEGEMLHRDSLGNTQTLRAEAINVMTAGNGISHAEESPGLNPLHMVQLWIALPPEQATGPANFQHYAQLPTWQEAGWQHRLLVGRYGEYQSDVEVFSPLVALDVRAPAAAAPAVDAPPPLTLTLDSAFEYGVLVLRGEAALQVDGASLADMPGLNDQAMLYLPPGHGTVQLTPQGSTALHVLLIGGEPLPESPLIWWNFVSDTAAEIESAAAQWNAGHARFGEVVGSPLQRLDAPPYSPVVRRS